jgi:integrase
MRLANVRRMLAALLATFVPILSGGDHMTGTITKRFRRDGKFAWGYSFFAGRTPEGKRIQITKSGFETRKEAADQLRKAIEHQRAGANYASHVSLSAFLNRWLDEHAKHRCTPKTLERYEQLGQRAIQYLGDTELQNLAPMAIESMLNNLLDSGGRKDKTHPDGRPLSPRTVCHIAFLVHDSLESAVRWGILPANPMDRVILPKAERKEVRVLDKQGFSQLLNAVCATGFFPLFVTAASTGCRRGELLALEWRDIDFQTGIITISKSLEQTKRGLRIKSTKSGKPRHFLLPSVALRVLWEHRRNQQQENPIGSVGRDLGLVFCSPEGTYHKPDQISSRISEITSKAGLPGIGLHSMRHAHASQLLSEGVPIPTVSKRLGHANPSITLKLYSHALESDELAAVKRWDDAFADVIGQAHDNRTPATKNMSVAPIGSCRKDSDNSVTDLSVNVNE